MNWYKFSLSQNLSRFTGMLYKFLGYNFYALLVCVLLVSNPVMAFEGRQEQLRQWGIDLYDPTCTEAPAGATATTPTSSAPPSTAREKAAQMVMSRVESDSDIDQAATLKTGGIFVPRNKLVQLSSKTKEKQATIGSWLVSIDGEGGTVGVEGVPSSPPSAQEMGALEDTDIQTRAKEFGQALKELGVNMDFAPVVDIGGTNQEVINSRAFANDAATVSTKAGAFSAGLREAGIVSTLKHFPGHGSKDGNSHFEPVETESLATLEGRDLIPYQNLKNNPNTAIMMGHLKVPDWGPTATSLNPQAYDYLRLNMGFSGVVITDALDMEGVETPPDEPTRAKEAIKAGADIALLNSPASLTPAIDIIDAAISSGEIPQARVDEALGRIANLKSGISDPSTAQSTDSGGCTCGSGSTQVRGSDRQEKSFNYFLDKGLTPIQSAAIVGNYMQESSPEIDPTLTNSLGTLGIAQWLFGRKTNLITYGEKVNVNQQDFSAPEKIETIFATQLDYTWLEVTGEGAVDGVPGNTHAEALEKLKAAGDNISKATLDWEAIFEVSGQAGQRVEFAQGVLSKYGSNAANGGGSSASITCGSGPGGQVVGAFSLPTDRSWYDDHPDWFTDPHHDYPAADIPVPTGTPIYAITGGTIRSSGGACGVGVTVDSPNGLSINYCHGSDGGSVEGARDGDQVTAGQLIMHSASTGRSTGPHLHVGLYINGTQHCPQNLFVGIAEGSVPDPASLPISGCSY